MTCDAAFDDADADFQRWYFGGLPPEHDGWDRHAFEAALQAPCKAVDRFETVRSDPGIRALEQRERLAA